MSHPIPLHPADGLERIIDEMRRCLRSRGDEDRLARIMMVLIFRELNRFLDILEDLLAKFRAGTLTIPCRVDGASTVAAQCEPAAQPTTSPPDVASAPVVSSPKGAASGRNRGPRVDDPTDDGLAQNDVPASPCPKVTRSSPRRATDRPEPVPHGRVSPRSDVARWSVASFGRYAAVPTHVSFVAIA